MDRRTAAELARGIGCGQIDPVALTDGFLDAIAAHPQGAEIYTLTTPDRARAEAMAARDRARNGTRKGLLDGVPLSWKDLFDSAGTVTEAGSPLLAGRVPGADAALLASASLGGSVCLGKTHMTELAFSGLGVNTMTATPPNLARPGHAPGGSSSGAAASVAHGLAPAAIGSDTGGSVRIPAAWNDLVGLKTTHGRLSLAGAVPLCRKFDTAGPLTRTVEDAALVLALLEARRAPSLDGAALAGRHLAVLETVVLDDCDNAPAQAFDRAVAQLAAAGARVTRLQVPVVAEAMALAGVIFTAEACAEWGDTIAAAPDRMSAPVRERFLSGRIHTATAYVSAWQALERHRAAWTEATAGFDAILAPTAPILPPEVAQLTSDADYFVQQNLMCLRNTRVGNLMGLPALTLPTGTPSCGLMLMGHPMGEDALLRLGAAAECALD